MATIYLALADNIAGGQEQPSSTDGIALNIMQRIQDSACTDSSITSVHFIALGIRIVSMRPFLPKACAHQKQNR
jgi:hypothetical protein